MKETKGLDGQLSELVRKGIEAAEKTGEFVIEQAPQLVKEFYNWQIISNSFFAILFALGVFITIFIVRKFGNIKESHSSDVNVLGKYYDEFTGPLCLVFGGGSVFMFVCLFLSKAYNLIYLTFAPKLYLIEYFMN